MLAAIFARVRPSTGGALAAQPRMYTHLHENISGASYGYELSHSTGRLLVERSREAGQFSEVIARSDYRGHPRAHLG